LEIGTKNDKKVHYLVLNTLAFMGTRIREEEPQSWERDQTTDQANSAIPGKARG
jgi:hypothetical protein